MGSVSLTSFIRRHTVLLGFVALVCTQAACGPKPEQREVQSGVRSVFAEVRGIT